MIQPPPLLNLQHGNISENFRRWEQQVKLYIKSIGYGRKPKDEQAALILHCAGEDAIEVYNTFEWPEVEASGSSSGSSSSTVVQPKDDPDQILKKFQDYCNPRKNVVYERFKFWTTKMADSFDNFITELRTKAKACDFTASDEMIRDKIVFSINDVRVQERLLREPELSLVKAIDICKTAEISQEQLKVMQPGTQAVNAISRKSGNYQKKPGKQQKVNTQCKYCTGSHQKGKCPAYGKKCRSCGKLNHFSKACMSTKKVHQLEASDDDTKQQNYDSFFIGMLDDDTYGNNDKWEVDLIVERKKIRCKLDTGAEANVLSSKTLDSLKIPTMKIAPTITKLRAFGGKMITPVGKVTLEVGKEKHKLTFHVIPSDDCTILGKNASEALGYVKRVYVMINKSSKEQILETYKDVFEGLGTFSTPYEIQLKADAKPSIQPTRTVPYPKQAKLKELLDKMTTQGIIADVDQPTDWVNNLVITEKPDGSMRICLDPKPLNEAIKREHHRLPTADDVHSKLANKKIFTVIDERHAFWQVPLTEDSSYLCTFHTPWGRKRFLRMPFGICSASEVMQKRNESIFGDIQDVHVIADDIIIAAKDEKEHDKTFSKVLERARSQGIKFKKEKIQYKVKEVKYMGNIISANGIKPDPAKVHAIVNMQRPDSPESLRRLLGLVKYLSQYIPGESDITAPLRDLLKEQTWKWLEKHENAWNAVKSVLTQQPVLQFYDVGKDIVIQADSSSTGLGAVLIQEGKPIAYASRALTKTECNYAQIEKELLSIVYAMRKFEKYILGKRVLIQNDHKPLETILRKPILKASPRLQRMMLQLQKYDYKLEYVPGKLMYIPDTLSRAYQIVSEDTDLELQEETEVMVHSLVQSLPVSSTKMDQFRRENKSDPEMQAIHTQVQKGWPLHKAEVPDLAKPFYSLKDEIHIANGVACIGQRLIVPKNLRKEMLERIHESHLGEEKCKSRARGTLYWPRMNTEISQMVSRCSICLEFRQGNRKEPIIAHEVKAQPFAKVGADLFQFGGKDYLIVVDYYSKYPEIALLENKSAPSVILHLKSIFARHGIPEELIADNNPFNSKDFESFAKEYGFKFSPCSPHYHQSNGLAERSVRTVKSMLKKANKEKKDPYIALMEYRNTPVLGQYSPNELLMSRLTRTKIPVSPDVLKPKVVSNTEALLKKREKDQERYYNKGSRILPELEEGQKVQIRTDPKLPWVKGVVKNKGDKRSYEVKTETSTVRRNRRHIIPTEKGQVPSSLHDTDERATQVDQPVLKEPEQALQEETSKQTKAVTPTRIPVAVTRSGRQVKTPSWLKDFEH